MFVDDGLHEQCEFFKIIIITEDKSARATVYYNVANNMTKSISQILNEGSTTLTLPRIAKMSKSGVVEDKIYPHRKLDSSCNCHWIDMQRVPLRKLQCTNVRPARYFLSHRDRCICNRNEFRRNRWCGRQYLDSYPPQCNQCSRIQWHNIQQEW